MKKRTPEQFLIEEGMTIDTARRIYSNIIEFIEDEDYQHIGCISEISTAELVKKIITNGTNHDDDTSARQFLKDIGENINIIDYNRTYPAYCDSVECRKRKECSLYKNTIKWEK